jgi:transposase
MPSYSLDLRERIVKAHVEEGQNKSEVARRFGVSRWTVDRYCKRAEAGCLAATPHPGSKPWLDGAQPEALGQQVGKHNDWTLEQHAEALAETTGVMLKKSAIDKYLRKLSISRKKRAFMQQSETTKPERSGETK